MKSSRAKFGTGDRGMTSLLSGPRVGKDHPRVSALGDLDELQSCLGVALAFLPKGGRLEGLEGELRRVQSDLFIIGSLVAAPDARGPGYAARLESLSRARARLHARTATAARRMPLRGFVAPGGPPASAFLHLARSVCRRAERSVVGLSAPPAGVVAYLNRLSSFLFSAAIASCSPAGWGTRCPPSPEVP